jgi:hypothetical protein
VTSSNKPRGRLDSRWNSKELRVVVRFARTIVAGKYPTVAAAIPKCRVALARVRPARARSAPAIEGKLNERSRALGRAERAFRWTSDEDRLADDFARAIIAGRYRKITAAILDFRQALARNGLPDRHTSQGIRSNLVIRTRALGGHIQEGRWTDAESRVARRFGRALARGEYTNAGAAVPDCQQALAAARLPARHPRDQIRDKIRRCANNAGLPNRHWSWSPREYRITDRYARAVARGEYPSVMKAVGDCRRELERSGKSPIPRTAFAVKRQLLARTRAAGWKPRNVRQTPAEKRVVDRFARQVAAGRIASAQAALSPCRRELARLDAPVKRTDRAILHHLVDRAHDFGRPPATRRWTGPELRFIRDYAQALGQGKYPSSLAAARACRQAMAGAGLPLDHSLVVLSVKLREQTLGWTQRKVHWTPEEDRLVADFARSIHEGRYAGVAAALTACAAALEQQRKRAADPSAARPRHTLHAVNMRLWEAAFRLGPRPLSRWRESEKRIIDRYARAVMRHRYPSIMAAARACCAAVNHLDARSAASRLFGRARPMTRPLATVHGLLLKRTWQLGRVRRQQPLWSSEERRISAKWAHKFDQHKRGRLRMNLQTMAGLMQAELRRQGYRRTHSACSTEICLRCQQGIK